MNQHHHANGGRHHDANHFDLTAAARRILEAQGFEPDFDAPAKQQLASLTKPASMENGVRDLRDRPWSSIDNTESRDLDQVEVAERTSDDCIRLVVGIADVDALVPKGSPIDEHAYANCTSVYTGIEVFPMLPEKLSTGLTSLNESEDRILEISRTGRMVMRRGEHTSRVLDAMRVAGVETKGEAEEEIVEIAAEEQV